MTRVGQNRVHQARVIEHRVAGFGIAQKIDQGNVIGSGTSESANDKIEIRRRESRPTIRPDHRTRIMSIGGAINQACSGGRGRFLGWLDEVALSAVN